MHRGIIVVPEDIILFCGSQIFWVKGHQMELECVAKMLGQDSTHTNLGGVKLYHERVYGVRISLAWVVWMPPLLYYSIPGIWVSSLTELAVEPHFHWIPVWNTDRRSWTPKTFAGQLVTATNFYKTIKTPSELQMYPRRDTSLAWNLYISGFTYRWFSQRSERACLTWSLKLGEQINMLSNFWTFSKFPR